MRHDTTIEADELRLALRQIYIATHGIDAVRSPAERRSLTAGIRWMARSAIIRSTKRRKGTLK